MADDQSGNADRRWFKGSAALAVDAWYRTGAGNVATNLGEARRYLESGAPFDDIIDDLDGRGISDRAFRYPHSDVLQGRDFEAIMRRGYLEAIGLAFLHDPPVPISTYWMTGAGNQRFEMHITDGDDHVAVTLLVPGVESDAVREGRPEAWVLKIDENGEVLTEQTRGRESAAPPSTRAATSD